MNTVLPVGIARVRENAPLPTYVTEGSVAFDIATIEAVTIAPESIALLPTGLTIATPEGYALLFAPRSSLFKKKGLRLGNTIGVIDQDFRGPTDELQIQVWNPGKETVTLEIGERIVQGFFVPIIKAQWEEFTPSGTSRSGFGSSGGYQS